MARYGKNKGSALGKYNATSLEYDAAEWCTKNNIKVSPFSAG